MEQFDYFCGLGSLVKVNPDLPCYHGGSICRKCKYVITKDRTPEIEQQFYLQNPDFLEITV